jgi:murein DD-endopeptidase MepM/ murein hydrolase activator NlpD
MAYPYTYKLRYPLESYHIDRGFLKECSYRDGKGKWKKWGLHLGEDYNKEPGTPVYSIGKGRVVWSKLHPGLDPDKRNWGNIVIVAHKNPKTKKPFFSVYGHLKKRLVERGAKVRIGQKIGIIAPANTKENGWWGESHLHFEIFIGEWQDKVLPGYYRKEMKDIKLFDWVKPNRFIRFYAKNLK